MNVNGLTEFFMEVYILIKASSTEGRMSSLSVIIAVRTDRTTISRPILIHPASINHLSDFDNKPGLTQTVARTLLDQPYG